MNYWLIFDYYSFFYINIFFFCDEFIIDLIFSQLMIDLNEAFSKCGTFLHCGVDEG